MVFESEIECPDVNVVSEASDRIKLALESYSADVTPFRAVGRAVAPAICRRVVLLIELRIQARGSLAGEHADHAIQSRDAHLGALGGERGQ
jgi:hypothetical protein